jgi:hypothetical protein
MENAETFKPGESAMRGCVVNGCLELAKWVPCVKVLLPDNDNPFKLDFENLCICETHKTRFTITDIITARRLLDIKNLFRLSFLTEPKLEYMTLTWLADSHTILLPVFDSNGKPIGNVNVINKDMSKKV